MLVTVHIITCSFTVHISPSKTIIVNLKIFQLNSETAIRVDKNTYMLFYNLTVRKQIYAKMSNPHHPPPLSAVHKLSRKG